MVESVQVLPPSVTPARRWKNARGRVASGKHSAANHLLLRAIRTAQGVDVELAGTYKGKSIMDFNFADRSEDLAWRKPGE